MNKRLTYPILLVGATLVGLALLRPRAHLVNAETHLTVQAEENAADIGIPGITKMYAAQLKNTGHDPVSVRVCDAVTDGMVQEISVAYAVERWDEGSKEWRSCWRVPDREFCRPTPTGIFEGHVREMQLLPGQTVSTNESAVQAVGGVHLGDRLRFIVFPYSKDPHAYISSGPFQVDERPSGSEGTPASLAILAFTLTLGWYIIVPAALILGWVRWVKGAQAPRAASLLSLAGFSLVTASGVLAVYSHFAGGFSGNDWWMLAVYGCGALSSVLGLALALCGAFRASALRWRAPSCAIATFLFWLAGFGRGL